MDTKDNNLIFMCIREVNKQDLDDKKSDLVVDLFGVSISIGFMVWILVNDLMYGGWLVCIAILVFMYVLVSDYSKYKKAKKKYEDSL